MNSGNPIKYPRRRLMRTFLRAVGRLVVRIFFKLEISGKENFPDSGPLIVVGNHTAVMEVVLLISFTPWQIEMLGSTDIPHEWITLVSSTLFGFIPIKRGHVDRSGLRAALGVLAQKGIIGIFPEGGIWEPGLMKAQSGVAWLSYRGATPVLPIGFSGALGALNQALRLKRPKLTMIVGEVIPAVQMKPGVPRKTAFETYSERVMTAVRDLVLPDDPSLDVKIKDESFELEILVTDVSGQEAEIPAGMALTHGLAVAKFLHRPAILKLFKRNLQLPIDVLENISQENDPSEIANAIQYVLGYLREENPYLLTYRFGPVGAEAMEIGLRQLLRLAEWAAENGCSLKVTPIRQFYSLEQEKEIVQVEQGRFEGWM